MQFDAEQNGYWGGNLPSVSDWADILASYNSHITPDMDFSQRVKDLSGIECQGNKDKHSGNPTIWVDQVKSQKSMRKNHSSSRWYDYAAEEVGEPQVEVIRRRFW